jgi:hypothetical protein
VTDYGVVFDNDNAIAGAGRNTDRRGLIQQPFRLQ